jgi:hypothetical protein
VTVAGGQLRTSPSGSLIEGDATGQVPVWDNDAQTWTPQTPVAPGGDVPPLARTYYVDPNTETPILEQDGSIAAPFFTLTYALEVVFAGPFSESLFLLVPWDYTGEPALAIPSNIKVQLQSLSVPGGYGTAYEGTTAKVGAITQVLAGEQGSLTMVNLECGGTWALVGSAVLIDCQGIVIEPGTDGVDPAPAGFSIVRGSISSIDAAGGAIDGAFFGPSPVAIDLSGSTLQVTNSELGGAAPTVTFAEEGGVVTHDLQTEGTAGGAPPFFVNLGETERLALPVQTITGTTEQEQLDSIVAALVALGFALDGRA